jgi:hypothetical protein
MDTKDKDDLFAKLGIMPAAVVADNSTLVLGLEENGASGVAIETALDLHGDDHVLYITFGANSLVDYSIPTTWDSITIFEWAQFAKVLAALRQGKLEYSCIILDHYTLALQLLAPPDSTPTQQQYGQMAVPYSTAINTVKAACDQIIVVLLVIDHVEQGRKIDLTPRATNNVLGKFRNKWYVYSVKGKNGEVVRRVQDVPKLALNFSTKKA